MKIKTNKISKLICLILCFLLCFEQSSFAQVAAQIDIAGHLSALHNALMPDTFRPLHLRYLSYDNLNNSFKLFLDKGSLKSNQLNQPNALNGQTKNLMQYFFIGLTLPNDSFWVNLRPDSPDNIIDDYLAQTDVGRIMLEADLQLKKDTALATSPQTPEGKVYWNKLYQKAGELFGLDNITIPTLTRPWIVPDEIIIGETANSAYIYKATLKVMLEQDYLQKSQITNSKSQTNSNYQQYEFKDARLKELNEYSSQLIRELIIPKLTKEINSSKRYAELRQVYYSLVFSQWFKARKVTVPDLINSRNLTNLTSKENWSKDTYFQSYQKSFKDGEYNLKENVSTPFGQTIRSYFSGGMQLDIPNMPGLGETIITGSSSSISSIPISGSPAVNPKVAIAIEVDGRGEISIAAANSVEAAQEGGESRYSIASSALEASKENKKAALNNLVQKVEVYLNRTKERLNKRQERLASLEEINAPEIIIEKEKNLVESAKQSLEEAEILAGQLKEAYNFDKAVSALREYSISVTALQQEALDTMPRLIPRLKKELVFFVDDSSLLAKVFGFGNNDLGMWVGLGEERLGIILLRANLSDAFRLAQVIAHEAWHMQDQIKHRSKGINKYLSEGITHYLQYSTIRKIISGRSKLAKLIREEVSRGEHKLGFFERMLMDFSGQLGEKLNLIDILAIKYTFGHEIELRFVEELVGEFGEDFIREVYLTGNIELLKEKLGEKFMLISDVADKLEHSLEERVGYFKEWIRSLMLTTLTKSSFTRKEFEANMIVLQYAQKIIENIHDEILDEEAENGVLDAKINNIIYQVYENHLIERYVGILLEGGIRDLELQKALQVEINALRIASSPASDTNLPKSSRSPPASSSPAQAQSAGSAMENSPSQPRRELKLMTRERIGALIQAREQFKQQQAAQGITIPEWSKEYGTFWDSHLEMLEDLIVKYRLLDSTKRILDVGTGDAFTASVLAAVTNAQITSVEIHPDRYKYAVDFINFLRTKGIFYSNLKISQEDFLQHPINNYDIVYFYYTSPLNKRSEFIQKVLEKLSRELIPGAVFVSPMLGVGKDDVERGIIQEYINSHHDLVQEEALLAAVATRVIKKLEVPFAVVSSSITDAKGGIGGLVNSSSIQVSDSTINPPASSSPAQGKNRNGASIPSSASVSPTAELASENGQEQAAGSVKMSKRGFLKWVLATTGLALVPGDKSQLLTPQASPGITDPVDNGISAKLLAELKHEDARSVSWEDREKLDEFYRIIKNPNIITFITGDKREIEFLKSHFLGMLVEAEHDLDRGVSVILGPSIDVPLFDLRHNQEHWSYYFSNDERIIANLSAVEIAVFNSFSYYKMAACPKHWIGASSKGRVEDTHDKAVTIETDEALLEKFIFPYKAVIEAGASFIMAGHAVVPAISGNKPVALSREAIARLRSLGFNGIIMSDELNLMPAVKKYYSRKNYLGQAIIDSFLAGVDMVLIFGSWEHNEFRNRYRRAIDRVVMATEGKDKIAIELRQRINESVRRILKEKVRFFRDEWFTKEGFSSIDQLMSAMSWRQKIGQMIMINANFPKVRHDRYKKFREANKIGNVYTMREFRSERLNLRISNRDIRFPYFVARDRQAEYFWNNQDAVGKDYERLIYEIKHEVVSPSVASSSILKQEKGEEKVQVGGLITSASKLDPDTIKALEDFVREGILKINASIDAEISALPENREKAYTLSGKINDAYKELFTNLCGRFQGIPEFDRLADSIRQGKFSREIVLDTLLPVLLNSGRFIMFDGESIRYKNKLIKNIPILSIFEVSKQYPIEAELFGIKENVLAVIIDNVVVSTLSQKLNFEGRFFYNLRIGETIPILINQKNIRKKLFQCYSARRYLEEKGDLPKIMRTGIEYIDNSLKELLKKQWPSEEFSQYLNKPHAFFNNYYKSYFERIISHEIIHIFLAKQKKNFIFPSDYFSYLAEIGWGDYRWLTLFEILINESDLNAYLVRDLFLGILLRGILEHNPPGSLPGISEENHRAAGQKLGRGSYPPELFMAIPLIPENILIQEAIQEFHKLTSSSLDSTVIHHPPASSSPAQEENRNGPGIDNNLWWWQKGQPKHGFRTLQRFPAEAPKGLVPFKGKTEKVVIAGERIDCLHQQEIMPTTRTLEMPLEDILRVEIINQNGLVRNHYYFWVENGKLFCDMFIPRGGQYFYYRDEGEVNAAYAILDQGGIVAVNDLPAEGVPPPGPAFFLKVKQVEGKLQFVCQNAFPQESVRLTWSQPGEFMKNTSMVRFQAIVNNEKFRQGAGNIIQNGVHKFMESRFWFSDNGTPYKFETGYFNSVGERVQFIKDPENNIHWHPLEAHLIGDRKIDAGVFFPSKGDLEINNSNWQVILWGAENIGFFATVLDWSGLKQQGINPEVPNKLWEKVLAQPELQRYVQVYILQSNAQFPETIRQGKFIPGWIPLRFDTAKTLIERFFEPKRKQLMERMQERIKKVKVVTISEARRKETDRLKREKREIEQMLAQQGEIMMVQHGDSANTMEILRLGWALIGLTEVLDNRLLSPGVSLRYHRAVASYPALFNREVDFRNTFCQAETVREAILQIADSLLAPQVAATFQETGNLQTYRSGDGITRRLKVTLNGHDVSEALETALSRSDVISITQEEVVETNVTTTISPEKAQRQRLKELLMAQIELVFERRFKESRGAEKARALARVFIPNALLDLMVKSCLSVRSADAMQDFQSRRDTILKELQPEIYGSEIISLLQSINDPWLLTDSEKVNTLSRPPASSSPAENKLGGIDFRSLPIVTQAIANFSTNISSTIRNRLSSVDLDAELQALQNMVNAGILPSSQRLKEYIQASCYKGNVDVEKIVLCISDIFRMEEECCYQTDATLRDILVILQSTKDKQELKHIFLGT